MRAHLCLGLLEGVGGHLGRGPGQKTLACLHSFIRNFGLQP